jgi:hypothetical protein
MYNSNLFKDIVSKLLRNQISNIDAIASLSSLIEKANDPSIRIKSMELLNKLEPNHPKLFQIFENCLISDEDDIIRKQAAKVLMQNYFELAHKTLKWAILNDNSSKVLRIIKNRVKNTNFQVTQDLKSTLQERLGKISELYNLHINEIELLVDLEINLNGKNYYIYDKNSGYIIGENFTCYIRNKHIRELSLSLRTEIPPEIYFLTELESLNLSFNYLSSLPNSINTLSKLKNIDLSWNEFNKVPTTLLELENLELIDLRNNKLKAENLGVKEINQKRITIIF